MGEQVTAPAGWYSDPNGSASLRWWDGASWTDHYAPGVAVVAERPKIPTETKIDGIWIWLIAALPLVSIATFLLIDFGGYMRGIMSGDIAGALASVGVGYLVSLALGWGAWGAGALFAYFDWRDLRAAGVVRPFHWAWAFLAGLVYLIGRTVIVRKVSPRGLGPLWAGIAVYVVVLIASIVWTTWMMAGIMQDIPYYSPYVSYS
jgi:hypothetical protein